MFTTQSHCEVGTIPQIHSRLLQEGFHVSEYALHLGQTGTAARCLYR